MNPTLDFRSRNSQKPSPVSQRIKGFENYCNEKKVLLSPGSSNVYIPLTNQIQSATIEKSGCSFPKSIENSLKLNIDNKNDYISDNRYPQKEVISISNDSNLAIAISTQNSIDKKHYSLKTGKATRCPETMGKRLCKDFPSGMDCDNIAEDDYQITSNSKSKKHITNCSNFPELNAAHKSHPYHKALNKPLITTIHCNQCNSRSRQDLVVPQCEKQESTGIHYKKNSSGIYKPVYSRQTRYPNPTKVESTNFPPNSLNRPHYQISLPTGHSNKGTCNFDNCPIQTKNISKFSSTKITTAKSQFTMVTGGDVSTCRTNTSLNKPQGQNIITTNIRPKAQNRIFEPENMDFSQLSSYDSLKDHLNSEKVNNFADSSTSKIVEISTKLQTVQSSDEDSGTHGTSRESFEFCTSKIIDEKFGKACPNVDSHIASREQGKLLEYESNNFNRIYSADLIKDSESSRIPKDTTYFTPFLDNTKVDHNLESSHNNQINLNSLKNTALPKLMKIERQVITTNGLSTNVSSYNLMDNIYRSFTTKEKENHNRDAGDFQNSTDVQYCRPLSFAKIDVQNWIKETIVMKDSITAAFLISSHIFEKISFYIAQRHAFERKETDDIIHDYQAQVKGLLDVNIILRKKLFFLLFENIKPTTLNSNLHSHCKYKIPRVSSLPTILNKNAPSPSFPQPPKLRISIVNECQASDVLLPTHSTDENHYGPNHSIASIDRSNPIHYYPSPPPDLPELDRRKIPPPPPNLPIIELRIQNDSGPSFSKPMKLKMSVSLKPLHWKRLSLPNRKNKVEIVWKMLPRQKIKPNDLTLFEESFSTQPPRKLFKSMKNQNNHSTKLPIEILPQEIASQLGIVCKNFEGVHIHLEDIEELLYSGDFKRSNLTTSILESLSKLITDERIRLVYDYVSKNPKVELTKESHTIHFFRNVPHVTMRFQHILYMQNFEEDIEHIHRNLNTIYHCCSKLRNSYELRILLSIILMLGNYMNQTYNSFKEAVGFNLELLPRLKETKTVDNSSTFLDFVSRCYLLNFEHNISQGSITNILPFPDTGDLFIASKITLNEVYDGLSNLGDQLTKIRENTRHFLQDTSNGKSNKYGELVEDFFHFAEKKIANEIDFWKVGDKTYQELIYYFYGESKVLGSQPDTSDFFGLWCNFASSFKEALVKAHKSISIKRRNDFIKSDTKIIPLCPSGLKQKVRYRTGSKPRFYHSTKSMNNS